MVSIKHPESMKRKDISAHRGRTGFPLTKPHAAGIAPSAGARAFARSATPACGRRPPPTRRPCVHAMHTPNHTQHGILPSALGGGRIPPDSRPGRRAATTSWRCNTANRQPRVSAATASASMSGVRHRAAHPEVLRHSANLIAPSCPSRGATWSHQTGARAPRQRSPQRLGRGGRDAPSRAIACTRAKTLLLLAKVVDPTLAPCGGSTRRLGQSGYECQTIRCHTAARLIIVDGRRRPLLARTWASTVQGGESETKA